MNQYNINEIIPFCKAQDKWGGFGNMAGGYPIRINKTILIPSVENLYQAMRYPDHPNIQKEILKQKSGFSSKLVSKKYRKTHTRPDFDDIKIDIMRWCLKLKCAQHKKYRDMLLETDDKIIVEVSTRNDDFWGAVFKDDNSILIGQNILGLLHMEIREYIKLHIDNIDLIKQVIPINVPNFKLLDQEIQGNKILLDF